MDKLKITDSADNTIKPADDMYTVTLDGIAKRFEDFYNHEDPLNAPHYKHGTLVDKDVSTSHKRKLKSILFLVLDDIKVSNPDSDLNRVYERTLSAINELVDIFETHETTLHDNKRMVSKLIGYILSLHLMHYS